MDLQKLKKVFRYFSLPIEEELLQEYTCSLELVYSGTLLITQNYLCFYSASFGRKIQKLININEIETIRKHKSMIFSPVLTIELQDRKKFAFHWKQAIERDNAFKKILELIGVQQEKQVTTITEEPKTSKSSSEPTSQSDYQRDSRDEIVLVTDQKSNRNRTENTAVPVARKESSADKKSDSPSSPSEQTRKQSHADKKSSPSTTPLSSSSEHPKIRKESSSDKEQPITPTKSSSSDIYIKVENKVDTTKQKNGR